jgi:hypothetical protein
VFLPPYSPDLNPIEYIWKSIKRVVSRNFIVDLDHMKELIRESFLEFSSKITFAKRWVEKFLSSTHKLEMLGSQLYKAFPKSHWKRIRTTNSLERINKELKRRSRVIGAFPNDASLLRLAVSILMDVNEEWVTGRRYLSMEEE